MLILKVRILDNQIELVNLDQIFFHLDGEFFDRLVQDYEAMIINLVVCTLIQDFVTLLEIKNVSFCILELPFFFSQLIF